MKPISIITGDDENVTLPYIGSTDELLEHARIIARQFDFSYPLRTNNPLLIRAFQALHKMREFDVRVFRLDIEYQLDKNGAFINTWPDELFDHDFNLLFHY